MGGPGPQPSAMGSHSVNNLRRVYVAYKSLFNGVNAKLRKKRAIVPLVDKFESPLNDLIKEMGKDNIVQMVRTLLALEVFESEQKAKIKFPELFNASPTRDVKRAASEVMATRSAAEAMKQAESEDKFDFSQPTLPTVAGTQLVPLGLRVPPTGMPTQEVHRSVKHQTNTFPGPSSSRPRSLYVTLLPYSAQHTIVSHAQRILEECFWDWAHKWLSSFIKSDWDCPAAVELISWLDHLPQWIAELPQDAFRPDNAQLPQVLAETRELRHAAVHRLPFTARGVDAMLVSSMKLTGMLRDPVRASQLENLHLELEGYIRAMERRKNALKDQLNREMEEIRRQRRELDKQEKQAIEKIAQEDTANTHLVGQLLKESVKRIVDRELPLAQQQADQDQDMDADEPSSVSSVGSGKSIGSENDGGNDSVGHASTVTTGFETTGHVDTVNANAGQGITTGPESTGHGNGRDINKPPAGSKPSYTDLPAYGTRTVCKS